jgi:hypothetical protein
VWGMLCFGEGVGVGKVLTLSAKNSLIFSAFDLGKLPDVCNELMYNKRLQYTPAKIFSAFDPNIISLDIHLINV